jgi:hypothetical protein
MWNRFGACEESSITLTVWKDGNLVGTGLWAAQQSYMLNGSDTHFQQIFHVQPILIDASLASAPCPARKPGFGL